MAVGGVGGCYKVAALGGRGSALALYVGGELVDLVEGVPVAVD